MRCPGVLEFSTEPIHDAGIVKMGIRKKKTVTIGKEIILLITRKGPKPGFRRWLLSLGEHGPSGRDRKRFYL